MAAPTNLNMAFPSRALRSPGEKTTAGRRREITKRGGRREDRAVKRGSAGPPSHHHFLRRAERQFGIIPLDPVDVPLKPGEVDDIAIIVMGDMGLVRGGELLDLRLRPRHPARRGELRGLETNRQPVFALDPAREHLELQLADDAHDEARAERGLEHLRGPFLGELHQRLVEVLGLHRVARAGDPMKAKHLDKALMQFAEEGAAKVFKPAFGSGFIVGVVGQLQFEVLGSRIELEYGLPVRFEASQFTSARWVHGPREAVEAFAAANKQHIAHDHDGDVVSLTRLQWDIDRIERDFPDITLSATKEMMV